MAITYTPEQQKVIELHNKNILVSAAAGSGKTAVLTERIVRMVCDEEHPVDIDRLLVVTFTNAAAAEMRERIAAGIAERLLEHPESEHLQRQSTLLHNAQITTIDSFSLFLIRNHFNEIGLDPVFRVADEGEIKLMQQEVLGALLEEHYGAEDEDFHYLVEYFCPGGREAVLEQHILNLVRLSGSFPWAEEWLEERKADYAAATVEELLESGYCMWLRQHLEAMLEGCEDKLKEAMRLCECPDGPYMYEDLLEQELEQIESTRQCGSLEEFWRRIPAITFGRLPSKRSESVAPIKRELVKALRSEVKTVLEKLSEQFFATPLELAVQQGRECHKPVQLLLNLAQEFYQRMQAKKQEKKLVDFSDMEHYALEILVRREGTAPTDISGNSGTKFSGKDIIPTAIALGYQQYFHEILIDEYQDSNLVQEYLLRAVSGESGGRFNRFMVGDVKQSIYKFRLARPELFLEKYDSYSTEGQDCQRIDLARNFRSRTEIVQTVNDVFSRLMSKRVGGIDYDERAALYAGAAYPEGTGYDSELLLVGKPSKEEELGAKEAEALAIALRLGELRGTLQVTDKETGQLRALRYSDCVILLRTNSGWDEVFKRVLEEQGIPAYITSKTGYFAAAEVQELLQVLRVLDNPRQDIPLFGMMKSVFGGFTEEEIALMRGMKKDGILYDAVQAYADGTESTKSEPGSGESLRMKARQFLEMVEGYRDCTVYLPVRELLQKLVDDFDYLNYVTALPAGSRRRANVEMLFTKASDFEKTSYFGLFHFIRYMEQLEKYDVDFGEAGTLDENADVVRIMSIHKSKGLEFPVVFVAGLSKRFNMQDANQSMIVDMDLGIGTDYVEPDRRLRNKTLRRSILARKMREDNLAEELRVLYVAFTRAKEKLILTATLEGAEEKWELAQERGAERLSYIDYMGAGSYLDFLLPILGQTCIQVRVVDAGDLAGAEVKEQVQLYGRQDLLRRAEELADEDGLVRLQQRFEAVYPFAYLSNLYTKTTVSELKIAAMADKDEAAYHTFEEREVVPYIPAFRRGQEKVSGTVRGNAFHRAMELLDFEAVPGKLMRQCPASYEEYGDALAAQESALKEALHEFLLREVESRRLTEEYFQALSEAKLVHFLGTSLAWRMWRAHTRGELYREQPFVLGLPADRLGEGFPASETVLIQGIIDVFFVEEGQIVLLDYKTDVIKTIEELWNRYEVQLAYYEEALSRLRQLPVKEKLLYSFYLEREGGY